MVAPATTSLLGFETVPLIAPVTVDWAIALSAQIARSTKVAKQNRRVLHITGELLRKSKSLKPNCARTIGRRLYRRIRERSGRLAPKEKLVTSGDGSFYHDEC